MSQSPFNFGKVHELETVTLRLSSASSAHLVAGHLAGLGFVVEDDFAYLPRSEPVPPWQASDVCQVSFYNAAEEVVDLEGVCDRRPSSTSSRPCRARFRNSSCTS